LKLKVVKFKCVLGIFNSHKDFIKTKSGKEFKWFFDTEIVLVKLKSGKIPVLYGHFQ